MRWPHPLPHLATAAIVAVWTLNFPMLVALGAIAGVLPLPSRRPAEAAPDTEAPGPRV